LELDYAKADKNRCQSAWQFGNAANNINLTISIWISEYVFRSAARCALCSTRHCGWNYRICFTL